MNPATAGIHHVTAIAGDPQENVDFHTDILGLRLVKRTVNFDDPGTYHLYFGDEIGTPGTIMTFFPFENGQQGRVGRGQVSATAYLVPPDSLEYWQARFDEHGVPTEEQTERFGSTVLPFTDFDGQPYELVVGESAIEPWSQGPVPAEYAIRGFHSVTLDSLNPAATKDVLEALGYKKTDTEDSRTRFTAGGDHATVIDVLDRTDASRGQQGVGTVHHVAVRTADDESQMAIRDELTAAGMNVTQQKDREYFRSIYFREPGGVLFEVATDVPGFDTDETVEELGSALQLPPWLADRREEIESSLPALEGSN